MLKLLESGEKKPRRARKLFAILALTAAGMTGAKSHVPPIPQYRQLTFRDFIVDGIELARKSAQVELTALYTRQGQEAVLYENENAYIMDHAGPAPGSEPTIPLLTDDASHAFREMLYSCDSQRSYGRFGCQLMVRGVATMCILTNGFGVKTDSPCIEVKDGIDASPAPLPPQSTPSASPLPTRPASPPQTNTLEAISAFQQKVRHCTRSAKMLGEQILGFGTTDIYHKCVKRIQAETAASSPAPLK